MTRSCGAALAHVLISLIAIPSLAQTDPEGDHGSDENAGALEAASAVDEAGGDEGEEAIEEVAEGALPEPLFSGAEEEEVIAAPEPPRARTASLGSSARSFLGERGALWLELGVTSGRPPSAQALALSPEVGLRYRVAEMFVADVSWGLTWAHTEVSGEVVLGGTSTPYAASIDRVDPGNPTLGGAFLHEDHSFAIEVGLSVSIPTAARHDPGADVDAAAQRASSVLSQRAAMSMRGYRGASRWAPERFSIAVPFRVVVAFAPVSLEIDGALAWMLPVLGDRGVDTDTLVELGLGAGADIAGPLSIGARVAGVGAATGTTSPAFTLSIEPWLRVRFEPVMITLRGVVDLSGDDRINGDRGPSFGVFLATGVAL